VGYGLFPNTELASLLGCQVTPAGVTTDDTQQTSVPSVYCAGECAGIGGVDLSLVEGEIAGYAAAGDSDRARALLPARERGRRFAARLRYAFALRPELMRLGSADTVVCRCEDVRLASLQAYTTFRAAKLHTRCGMGPCQGRICGTAAHYLLGWANESVRPPVFPASIGTLALQDDSLSKEALETL
jgi:NADPH-dependent 2,4-dienoyl-CoA reductase/sulfur reductase-like enzyme